MCHLCALEVDASPQAGLLKDPSLLSCLLQHLISRDLHLALLVHTPPSRRFVGEGDVLPAAKKSCLELVP